MRLEICAMGYLSGSCANTLLMNWQLVVDFPCAAAAGRGAAPSWLMRKRCWWEGLCVGIRLEGRCQWVAINNRIG